MIKHGLSQIECEAEGLFMIMAGTESTASAIRAVLVHVMTCPQVYAKLKAEIKAAVALSSASTPVIQLKEAKCLPYLQACIYEGLRMRPALLGLLPKVVPPGGDPDLLPGVPAGTAICMNTSSMLRSEKMFGPDADVYRPERFMELESPERRREMEMDVEMVFGYGQWMCVGKTIAFMELNKAIFEVRCRLLQQSWINLADICFQFRFSGLLTCNWFSRSGRAKSLVTEPSSRRTCLSRLQRIAPRFIAISSY